MKNKIVILILIALILGILGYFFVTNMVEFDKAKKSDDQTTVVPTTTTSNEETQPTENTTKPADDKDSTTGESTKNIEITSPAPNSLVSAPFTITGQARVFENQFNYRVVSDTGLVLAEGNATADAQDMGQFGAYTINIEKLAQSDTTTGKVEVFDYSPKDGSEADLISIPVRFE